MIGGENRPQPEAISELRDLEEEPAPGFFRRVQRSVERRQLASESVDLSWNAVRVLVLEVLDLIFHLFDSRRDNEGEGR